MACNRFFQIRTIVGPWASMPWKVWTPPNPAGEIPGYADPGGLDTSTIFDADPTFEADPDKLVAENMTRLLLSLLLLLFLVGMPTIYMFYRLLTDKSNASVVIMLLILAFFYAPRLLP